MPEDRQDLESAWTELAFENSSPELLPSRPLSVETPNGPLRIAIDAHRIRHLLIPAGRLGDIVADKRSRGVVVVPQELEMEGEGRWFADLVCVDPQLSDVYTRLAVDVCSTVAKGDQRAATVPAMVLDQWRELLSSPRRAFGRQDLIGLYGELIVLQRAVALVGPSVLRSWVGPTGDRHDFAARSVSLEVKSSASKQGRKVEIHGLEQLWSPAGTALFLAFVRLLPDPNGTRLSDLVQDLLNADVPRRAFLKKLQMVGWDATAESEIDEEAFVCRELAFWEVSPTFPRITPDSFTEDPPIGIESVTYTVDLAGAGTPIDEPEVSDVLQQLLPAE